MSDTGATSDAGEGVPISSTTDSQPPSTSKIRSVLSQLDTPIYRLPVELLSMIFHSVADTCRYHMDWTHVLHVCKRWYDIGCNTSSLWQHICISSRTGVDCLSLALSRSRGVLLDVHIGDDWEKRLVPDATIMRLVPEADRLRSLTVNLLDDHTIDILRRLLLDVGLFANMEELAALGSAEGHLGSVDCFYEFEDQSRFPQLRKLCLYATCIPLESPIISQLRVLDLSEIGLEDEWLLGDFLKVLGTCHQLEKLRFDFMMGIAYPVSPQDKGWPDRIITLPRLRSLYIFWQSGWDSSGVVHGSTFPSDVYLLLSHIHFPPAANIELELEVDLMEEVRIDYHRLLPRDSTCLPILENATSVVLSTAQHESRAPSTLECCGGPGQGSFSLSYDKDLFMPDDQPERVWPYRPDAQLLDFCLLFRHAPLTSFTIELAEVPLHDLCAAFRTFPALTTLEVVCNAPGAEFATLAALCGGVVEVSALRTADILLWIANLAYQEHAMVERQTDHVLPFRGEWLPGSAHGPRSETAGVGVGGIWTRHDQHRGDAEASRFEQRSGQPRQVPRYFPCYLMSRVVRGACVSSSSSARRTR
ncbi:hypothetical protein BD413DRAFT_226007 [Trametes elegans]|nr:hypothetical protein BD413DRAFT_226007 [Trametes elegans]